MRSARSHPRTAPQSWPTRMHSEAIVLQKCDHVCSNVVAPVAGRARRAVRTTVPAEVGCEAVVAMLRKERELVAPAKPKLGPPMEEEDGGDGGRAAPRLGNAEPHARRQCNAGQAHPGNGGRERGQGRCHRPALGPVALQVHQKFFFIPHSVCVTVLYYGTVPGYPYIPYCTRNLTVQVINLTLEVNRK